MWDALGDYFGPVVPVLCNEIRNPGRSVAIKTMSSADLTMSRFISISSERGGLRRTKENFANDKSGVILDRRTSGIILIARSGASGTIQLAKCAFLASSAIG